MRVVKFINKFLALILSFAFATCILFMLLIITTKTMVTQESISRHISQTNIFKTTSEIEQNSKNKTLEQTIIAKLEKMEISEDITKQVLESEELNNILSEYVYNYINYVVFDKAKKDLSCDQIIAIVEKEYLTNTGTNLTIIQKQQLEDYVNDLTINLNNQIPSTYELEELGINIQVIRHYSSIIFSQQIIYILGLVLLLLYMLIVICLWNKRKALCWCSITLIIDGIILLIGNFAEVKILSMLINNQGIIEKLVITIADRSFDELLVYGIVLMAIGLILLIISMVMYKKEQKVNNKNFEPLLNDVIEETATNQLKQHIVKTDDDIQKIEDTLTKIELEKVFLETQQDLKSSDRISINTETEIPKINIEGNDFVEKDQDNIKVELIEKDENTKEPNKEKLVIIPPKTIEKAPEEEEINNGKEIEIVEIEKIDDEVENNIENNESKIEYEELDDSIEKQIIKEEIEIPTLEEINLNIISPKKGKEIEVKIETLEEEEEIEIL